MTHSQTKADVALNRIRCNDQDGRAIFLHITEADLAAIGIEPEGPDTALTGAKETQDAEASENTHVRAIPRPRRTTREDTKQASLIAILRAPGGATIEEIMAATGWHGARREGRGAE